LFSQIAHRIHREIESRERKSVWMRERERAEREREGGREGGRERR